MKYIPLIFSFLILIILCNNVIADSYLYYKDITITGESGAGTDYQIKLEIGASVGGDFHLEGHCMNFPQDIDVTDDDGITLLDFWVEDITTDPIVMYVKVDDDLGSNQTIRVYYGKSGATTNSNITTTFLFGDDFNRINSSTVGNGWTEDLNTGNGDASIESDMLKLYTPDTGSDSMVRVIRDLTSLGLAQFILESKMQITEIEDTTLNNNRNLFGVYDGDGSNNVYMGSGYLSSYITGFTNYSKDDVYHDYGGAPAIDTWQRLKLTYDITNEFIPYFNNSAKPALTGRPLYSNPFKLFFYQLVSATASGTGTLTSYYDYTFVRKYNDPEPAFTNASNEETVEVKYVPADPINLGHITGNFWINHTWDFGGSNVTDSYNVSVNAVWHNTTIDTFYNDTYAAHEWQNITVWAYNTSNGGSLSVNSINQDTQIPNNPVTITNTSDWTGNAGEVVYVDYDAIDADSDTSTFSCDRIDLFTDFDTVTGKGNWTATANIYYVDFGVSDGYGSTSNYTMTLWESSITNGLLAELKLIMSETTIGLKSVNMGDYLIYAFILIGILLIILLIQILNNCIYRG